MKRDEELLAYLAGDNDILDGSIKSIHINNVNGHVNIDIQITLIRPKVERELTITFLDVIEYSFNYDDLNIFQYIERYKFFKSENGFYVSFDPLEEANEITDEDNDIILSKHIQGDILPIL